MISSGIRCTIVVPCYNEAERLPLASWVEFLKEHKQFRFLFVNDGSTDETLEVVQQLRAAYPPWVDVLDQPENRGKAEAVRAGVLHAIDVHQPKYVGFWDADLATPLQELPRFADLLEERPQLDIIMGSRVQLLGRSVNRRTLRHYTGRAFATFASFTLKLPVYDTQCGAKLFRITPTIRQLFASPFYSRWTFDVELLARFLRAHELEAHSGADHLYEEPLMTWTDVNGSKLRVQDSFQAIWDLLYIRRRYFKA